MPQFERVMVIGLDCAAPQLVFEQFAGQLPHLDRLRRRGQWGRLESVVPPITVPAWACMMSGRDPGRLGIYGFRNRTRHDYSGFAIANSLSVQDRQVWDYLSDTGARSVLIGVPPSFPPRPVHGWRVGCFLTPSTTGQEAWTHPRELAEELHRATGGYEVDVMNFRTDDKDRLLADIFRLSDKQFDAALHLARTKDWRYFMMVNIAVDRMHHGFWRYFDRQHRKHERGNRYEAAMLEFYRRVDARIGELLELADDQTAVLVVSDHGAKRIDGGVCINEWLVREGLLAVDAMPKTLTPLAKLRVDWARTRAWSEGGYYARVFINKQGREPMGCVAAADYEAFRDDLARRIAAIPDDQGRPMGTRVFKPEQLYPEIRGVAPDLLVHFGDLHWRSIGTLGHGSVHTLENDTGPDDANHAQHGMYILAGRGIEAARSVDRHLLGVAPTILDLFGLPVPAEMTGPPLLAPSGRRARQAA
jgi:predicted AlkP superfamily phosphohydrolase/phosphomutase